MESELVLPYGPAPAISFIIHEIVMVALFAVCLFHAVRRGATFISYLLGGVLFGLLLEYVNVNAGLNYSYGQFWLMLGPTPESGAIPQNIPVNIGIGWGIIIYTARLFSDNLGLPVWSRPALDALLALNVDLSMDAVAYRLNMWHWGWEFIPSQPDPLASEWFGVPYANFYGWLSFSFTLLLLDSCLAGRRRRVYDGCGYPSALLLLLSWPKALFSYVFGYCRVGSQVCGRLLSRFSYTRM